VLNEHSEEQSCLRSSHERRKTLQEIVVADMLDGSNNKPPAEKAATGKGELE